MLAAYVRPVAGVPGTVLGRPRPADERPRARHVTWNYWWQAHLLDCLVDAQQRDPTMRRRRLIERVIRSVWLRNGGWCNTFYDDMAWLALALGRVAQVTGAAHTRARTALTSRLRDALDVGILTWRSNDDYRNAPANGPTAILLARDDDRGAATTIVRWLTTTLTDPASRLVIDGVHADGRRETALYTYNQGVTLGALVEVHRLDPDPTWSVRAADLVDAVHSGLTRAGVLFGQRGGDGALFAGICARYLTLAARHLDLDVATDIVLASAQAAWDSRDPTTGRFAADWSQPAGDGDADLSAQLSAWMTLEAAALLAQR